MLYEDTMATSGQIQRSIKRFQDFASDLIRSDMDTFSDRLALFIHFCETDEFFAEINKQMEARAKDLFDGWLVERMKTIGGMAGSGDLSFPVDLDERMAIQLELLRRINLGAIDFFDFTHRFFSIGSNISDHIRALNEAVTKALAREMKYRLEEVLEQLPEDKRAEVPTTINQVFNHVGSIVQQNASGGNISQVATIGCTDELKAAFIELRAAVATHVSDKEALRDHNETIDAAEQLATSEKSKPSAVKTLLGTLPAIASVAGSVATILKILF